MIVLDHTDPSFSDRAAKHGRTNGAITYSRDIVKWHVPVWQALLGAEDVVATCAIEPRATVQYLHERTYAGLSSETKLFVTPWKDLADALGKRGLWLPNCVDEDILPEHRPTKGWVLYGNTAGTRVSAIRKRVMDVAERYGIDVVSGVGDQRDALEMVSRYRYGIGVGRCAIEMMAIGLKVLFFGNNFGGAIVRMEDAHRHAPVNFNATVMTGFATVEEGMARIDEARPAKMTFQIFEPDIRARIYEGWQIASA